MTAFKKQLLIKLGISSGALILIIGAVQLTVWHVSQTSEEITRQRSELSLRTRATQSLATLKSDAEKAKPLQASLGNVLPPKDRLINFGKELTDLGKQNGLELSFDFGGETPSTPDAPGFIKFTLTGTATYTSWTNFLKDLEKGRMYVKINSADLARKPGLDNFNVVAEGQVFFQ